MAAPSPSLLRIWESPGALVIEYDLGGGPVLVDWSPAIADGVVSGAGLPTDLLADLQAYLIGLGMAGSVVSLTGAWRVSLDVSASGSTVRVMGSLAPAAGVQMDARLLGFDAGIDTPAAAVLVAPEGPLGTWASPVPLGSDGWRARSHSGAQVVAESGRVVTVTRGSHLATSWAFSDVPRSAVFHDGAALTATHHPVEAFERWWQLMTDGAGFEYCPDQTANVPDGKWVPNLSATDFAPSSTHYDGHPFHSFSLAAFERIA